MSARALQTNSTTGTSLPKAIRTLDLHGCTKSEGTCRTTEFLDRTSGLVKNAETAWVLIITGSGAHSPQGPVLRGAIEALLDKRKMEYHLLKGKGSFMVNVSSGFVLYDLDQPTDSKVVVTTSSSSRSTAKRGLQSIIPHQVAESAQESGKELKKNFYKKINEEAAFRKAEKESLEEEKKRNKEVENQIEQYERALSLSRLDELEKEEEEKKLIEAMEISKRELILQSTDEEEQLRKATELSKIEHDCRNDPEAFLRRVIELSRIESNPVDDQLLMMLSESSLEHSQNSQEDEDLLQALELSVTEF
eukprot:jgi/Psemu1/291917/fgenesh1_pg.848_\